MTSKDRINGILNRRSVDRTGFWLGNPVRETKKKYCRELSIETEFADVPAGGQVSEYNGRTDIELALKFESDFVWFTPELDLPAAYKHPEGKPIFDVHAGKKPKSLFEADVFSECDSVSDVEKFDWPNADYLDFSNTASLIDNTLENDLAVFSGMWCPFFHVVSNFFGMEEYFVKMLTEPEIVLAVTEKVVDFYLEANKRFFDKMANKIDAAFFGNDLGSQLDCLISPELFKRFVLPYIKKLVEQMKSYNLKVAMHSCGSIVRFIPDLIDAGIDALHPLQAKAAGMSPEYLVREYKNDLIFIGGVDTQELLPFGTPEQVRSEVLRLIDIFGDGFIVSPSHEALLPNVCLENAMAMKAAACL